MTGMDVLKCPVCKKGNLLTNELHLGYKAPPGCAANFIHWTNEN